MSEELIALRNCRIQNKIKTFFPELSWEFKKGESWLVIGPNGGGKADFVKALAGQLSFVPISGSDGDYKNCFEKNVAVVSLEEAASLIEEERNRDESEYMDKEDIGRTGRAYISEVLGGSSKKNAPLPEIAWRLETMAEVKLCGVEKILDRGLRYMSTGEIRRTLLCRALLSGSKLLVLSDPFAGLDAESRRILLEFFTTIVSKQLSGKEDFPHIILCMERFHEIPESINRVVEFRNKKISFCGPREEYEVLLKKEEEAKAATRESEKTAFLAELAKIRSESKAISDDINSVSVPDSLIKFDGVNVGWEDHHVLVDLEWEVKKGDHYLVRGPNGSGKTTIMELITGDNMQVFREPVYLFGNRRGTGETIWDIKRQLGIVSYRLHVEYRMVGGTDLQNVIISGFHDSLGLYQNPTDYEIAVAKAWLKLAGFAGRERESFGNLSYGEQRAILILRAAVKSPRVLILDEPCHGLDENYREKILNLLETIAETGTTTLLHVTHDPSEVLPCERHVLELHPGETPMYKIIERNV
ncbi:ATP-binding cassette domain-containing protein [Treponema sp.]|uniref:ATP-binding cassette domain-containing protein n=1 Tax=Treponema sp. TaxID=166 RepID=UPI002A7EDF02|nr:ATP-binding cassette domain-containing protein [Treponema sp.]MDY4131695.1 ATP-binding cassette domain-containing protein [Treponema sp.]